MMFTGQSGSSDTLKQWYATLQVGGSVHGVALEYAVDMCIRFDEAYRIIKEVSDRIKEQQRGRRVHKK